LVHSPQTEEMRPETEGAGSFLFLLIGILIGTVIVLLLVKFKKPGVWKIWFFLAVWITISIALQVIVLAWIAMVVALALAILKIYKSNVIIHNLTEVLMYSGIAVLLVPIFNVFWIIMLLIAISIYDVIAVWHSKHMVKMAMFQAESKVFAGLMIPYNRVSKHIVSKFSRKAKLGGEKDKKGKKKPEITNAILGGGDVAFPLLFTGVVMEGLILKGMSKSMAFSQSLIIVITTAIALTLLFVYAKKDKFYPAMPFVTAGCMVGWVIVLLL
ncbi:MAG: presenilin family intramembrane aspartyl protease, partial [archaeon]